MNNQFVIFSIDQPGTWLIFAAGIELFQEVDADSSKCPDH